MCSIQSINSSCKKYHLDAQKVWRERKQLLYQLFPPKQKQLFVDGKAGKSKAISKGLQWNPVAEKQTWCFSHLRAT